MSNDVALTLPVPTLVVIGAESDASLSGSVALALPRFQFSAGTVDSIAVGSVAFSLPLPTLTSTGTPGVTTLGAQIALTLPLPVLAVSGVTGVSGSVALTLPMPTIRMGAPDRVDLVLPTPTLAISGVVASVGTVDVALPTLMLAATGSTQFVSSVALALPTPLLAVSGYAGATGGVSVTLARLALAASGYTGAVGSAVLTLPMPSLAAAGSHANSGSVTIVLPMLQLQASGRTAASGTSQAYALHLETQALSRYTNYGFNSMARFNGVYLGCTESGIFALTGTDDAGVAIDAVARVGVSDFGTAKIKRVDRAYIGYTADGDLQLNVITDGDTTRSYRLAATGKTGIHGNHVRIGKGVQARYWQYEIANINGADFAINCIEVKPSRLGRRVGGDDA